jgi:hypothetical protein
MPIKLPSLATTIVGAALAVIVALNDQVFHFGSPWQLGINVGLPILGALGFSIISGPQFRTIVELPQQAVAVIAAALSGVQLVLADSTVGVDARTVLQCLVVVAATLGFGPTINAKARALLAPTAPTAADGKHAFPARTGVDG